MNEQSPIRTDKSNATEKVCHPQIVDDERRRRLCFCRTLAPIWMVVNILIRWTKRWTANDKPDKTIKLYQRKSVHVNSFSMARRWKWERLVGSRVAINSIHSINFVTHRNKIVNLILLYVSIDSISRKVNSQTKKKKQRNRHFQWVTRVMMKEIEKNSIVVARVFWGYDWLAWVREDENEKVPPRKKKQKTKWKNRKTVCDRRRTDLARLVVYQLSFLSRLRQWARSLMRTIIICRYNLWCAVHIFGLSEKKFINGVVYQFCSRTETGHRLCSGYGNHI